MGRHNASVVGALLLVIIAGCTSPSLSPTNQPLNGKAYLNAPLDGAKVVGQTSSGTLVDIPYGATTMQGRIFAQLSLMPSISGADPQGLASYLPLTVKVSGGTYNGTAFDGTLLGYLPEFTATPNVPVNILTTLIVKYMQAAGVSYAQAETAVTTGLGLPANLSLAAKLNNPNYWHYFNPTRFMALAKANGGFDAFTDKIVANLIQTQKPGFALTGEAEGAPGIGSKAGQWLAENTCSGLVAWAAGGIMDWILNGFGTADPTQQALNEIENQLTVANNTLTAIQGEITTLTDEVTRLLQLVNLEWANLIATYDSLNMSTDETTIQNEYGNLLTQFPASNPIACTPAGNAAAMAFARQILSTSASNIDQHIYNIYAQMMGQVAGTNGALYDMTTQLIVQAQSGQDLLQCYYVLENYFGQLVAIQAQGLNLMIQSIHEVDNTSLPYPDNATQYYAKYQQQIDNETEIFLACVDRLVVSGINVRSQIVQPFSYLPTETATIYNRADFVASQLSSLQPAGLVIRLIGDPTHVTDWITNNRITANGSNFTVVSVNGNTTNNYAAPIPASTPGVSYYLEWTPNGTAYTFQQQDNISVVKLKLSASSPGSYTVISPTDNQTLSVAWYNIDFQQISSPDNNPDNATDNTSVLYGSGVFFVRVFPTWQADTGVKTQDTKNQWATIYTPDPADFSLFIQSYPYQLRVNGTAPITYTGGIYTTIANGGTENVSLAFTWNAAQDTTNNFYADVGGNQCLICQSVNQQANDNTTMTTGNVTLTPNTNTVVNYQVQQVLPKLYASGLEYGDLFTTNAWINSLEVIPQP